MSLTWDPIPAPPTLDFIQRFQIDGNAATDTYSYVEPPEVPFSLNTQVYFSGSTFIFDLPDLLTDTLYYVVNPTATTFQVSLSPSGPVETFTTDVVGEYVFEYGPLPTGGSGTDSDISVPSGAGFGSLNTGQIIFNACEPPSGPPSFAYTDGARAFDPPSNGSVAETPLTASNNFEIRFRPRRVSSAPQDIDPIGNIYIGLTRTITSNINQWDYCVNIHSAARVIRRFPHPANSVLIFENDEVNNPLPPRPIYWKHSVWKNLTITPQLVRMQGINGQMRYLIDDTVIYTSRLPIAVGEIFRLAVLFDCSGQQVTEIELLTGGNALVGADIASGTSVGDSCSGPFTVNGSTSIISGISAIQAAVIVMPALPQGADNPIPVRFQETAVSWGEFEQRFGTGMAQANTIQTQPIRRFEIEWDGLSPDEAAILDSHYERSHQGIPFSITNPHTGEIVTNCRYASYTRGDHTRYWIQSRSAVIMRNV